MVGYSREELIGFNLSKIDSAENNRIYSERIKKLMRNESILFEGEHVRKDGSRVPVEVSAKAVSHEKKGIIHGFVRDITERKRLEQQLLQSQKMETIGRLAGGIAHDFNNILTVINGNAEMSLMFLDKFDPSRDAFEEIRKSGERAASLTRQLLAFSRKQIVEPQVINLNSLFMEMDKMLRRLIGEHIELITIPADTLSPVRADPGQIEQVLTNLVVNARDAMPAGGKLTIETRNVQLDEEYAKTHPETKPGKYVMFAVTDTGTGMDDETRSLAFEPFFTTKPKGSGTGLGLSTCYGIVQQNNGGIWLYSEPGKGTSVKVYLPVYESASISNGIPKAMELPRGTETILLVEDDPGIRYLITRLLQKTGYRVQVASNGSEALSVINGEPGIFHLLVTDVVMPLMGGKELADRVSEILPDIKILFMSGYTDDSIVHHGILEEGILFIQKPFTPGDFLRKVREALDA
jgi:signal transduction histidine kinase